MKNIENDSRFNLKAGLVFLLFTIVFWIILYYSFSISLLLINIFASLITASILLNQYNENYVIYIIQIVVGWSLGIVYFLAIIALSFLLIILSVLIIWEVLISLFNGAIELVKLFGSEVNSELYQKPIIYCSTLITGLVMSYQGDKVLSLFYKILNVGHSKKNDSPRLIAKRILQVGDLRKRFYEFSILLYVLKVIEDLSKSSLFSWELWTNYKPVALEVLLTFVAIDGYVSNFLAKSKK